MICSKKLSEMTDAELIKEAKEMDSMIYDVECYSVNDMRWLFAINEEMRKRNLLIINEVYDD